DASKLSLIFFRSVSSVCQGTLDLQGGDFPFPELALIWSNGPSMVVILGGTTAVLGLHWFIG
ncbi:MAG: hypothetical protein NZ703_14980, partial [Gemmataceae bacterium]|nr:hypothetical protein [Gemmataceae bacterium]